MDHRNPPDRGSNPRTVIVIFIVISSLRIDTANAVSKQVIYTSVNRIYFFSLKMKRFSFN